MSGIFVTGSSDGLGLLAAQALLKQGHQVVLHARSGERKRQLLEKTGITAEVLVADLAEKEQVLELAEQVNRLGTFDAVIHNAGLYREAGRGANGWPLLFHVNSLAPYILTCRIRRPKRLVYLSSDMHLQGDVSLQNIVALKNGGPAHISYSDTKLHNLLLAFAVARKWKGVYSNALHPGWVPTKMGGAGAPDSLEKGSQTQVWLAGSDDPEVLVSGNYYYHKRPTHFLQAAADEKIQDRMLNLLEEITGVAFPV